MLMNLIVSIAVTREIRVKGFSSHLIEHALLRYTAPICRLNMQRIHMEKLDTLWKLVNAASTVRDLAVENKTFQFQVEPPTTFYLHADYADVTINRWDEAQITVKAKVQASFGWRIKTDQDADGVYIVAVPRADLGRVLSVSFEVFVPQDTYLLLKLKDGKCTLGDINGTLQIPPIDDEGTIRVVRGE